MSYLLWHATGAARIASSRQVLHAAEVPLLQHAGDLREQLARLHREEGERLAQAQAEARQQGHAQGLQEGRGAAREEIAQTLVALAQASAREREQLRREIASLSLQVARKLLGRYAEDERLAALADTAARDALPAQQLTLVVHASLADAVRERLAAPRAASDATPLRFEVRGDPACAHDTCRVETEHGSVDASLEGQLARLAKAWEARA